MSSERHWACVVGLPIRHSLSPAMHNAGFRTLGLDAEYVAWEVESADLPLVARRFRERTFLGANVTAPHKHAIMSLIDQLDPEARLMGVANTIVPLGGLLVADNTDARGLEQWLRESGVPVVDQDVIILGAGGQSGASLSRYTALPGVS